MRVEAVHVLTFGSPCQDLSVAGSQSGLQGKRSGLFFEAIRIIKEMRCATNELYPTIVVWENVEEGCSSWQILEENAAEKYYLSPAKCTYILHQAQIRRDCKAQSYYGVGV